MRRSGLARSAWRLVGLVLVGTLLGGAGGLRFADLWLTPDQQGRLYFERGDDATAASRFEDPVWKGVALLRSGDPAGAVGQFARADTATAWYDLGNAYVEQDELELALAAYEEALEREPEAEDARFNRDLVARVLAARAEAQEDEEEEQGEPALPPDEVQFDEKGEKGKEGEIDQSLLRDEPLSELWLRQLTTTPADFLRLKFRYQAEAREESAP